MDLFDHLIDPKHNLLPVDGEVYYYGRVLSLEDANHYYHTLLTSIGSVSYTHLTLPTTPYV